MVAKASKTPVLAWETETEVPSSFVARKRGRTSNTENPAYAPLVAGLSSMSVGQEVTLKRMLVADKAGWYQRARGIAGKLGIVLAFSWAIDESAGECIPTITRKA